MLADQTGVEAGAAVDFTVFADSVTWSSVSFPVLPRRSRIIQCVLYPIEAGSQFKSGAAQSLAKVSFRNPVFSTSPACNRNQSHW